MKSSRRVGSIPGPTRLFIFSFVNHLETTLTPGTRQAVSLAQFFKYHDLEQITSDCHGRGLSLRFQTDLENLFRPAWVGPLKVGNRLCIQPMEGCDATLDGHPDDLTFRRFERFGSGGAKLIWGEAAAVVPEGRANPRQLVVCPANAKGLARLVEICRRAHQQSFGASDDLVLGLQLTHSGRYSHQRPVLACHDPLLDRRTIIDRKTGKKADADVPLISDDDLWKLADHYVEAARIAHEVGFQFIDVKQCHRYLLNELLSARNRPGLFGGSLENRTRMARTILERIRTEVPGLVLASRLNLHDGIPFHKGTDGVGQPDEHTLPVMNAWGTNPNHPLQPDLTEPLWWIGEMKKIGVRLINLSLGNPYCSPHLLRPFQTPPPDGYLPPEHPLIGVDRHVCLTGQVQEAYPDLAVVGSGYSFLQEFLFHAAAANIRDGRTTFVGVGRASLSMPDFARQLMETGTLDRRRICRTFSYCTALMRSKHNELGQFATGCPPFDKEVYGPLWKQANQTIETGHDT